MHLDGQRLKELCALPQIPADARIGAVSSVRQCPQELHLCARQQADPSGCSLLALEHTRSAGPDECPMTQQKSILTHRDHGSPNREPHPLPHLEGKITFVLQHAEEEEVEISAHLWLMEGVPACVVSCCHQQTQTRTRVRMQACAVANSCVDTLMST